MEEIIKVTTKRIPVIIGPKGVTKRKIEKQSNTRLDIDSATGEIIVIGSNNYYDIHLAKKIITAISRGFSPEVAFLVTKPDYNLEILSLTEHLGKNDTRLEQIKGRIIGREGTIKNLLEKQFNANISVFGKTVGVIAKEENIYELLKILESIIGGCKHTTVFKMLKTNKMLKNYKEVEETPIDDIDFNDQEKNK